jgi:hypothetical protein
LPDVEKLLHLQLQQTLENYFSFNEIFFWGRGIEIKYANFNILKDVPLNVPLENMPAKIGKHKNNAGFFKKIRTLLKEVFAAKIFG